VGTDFEAAFCVGCLLTTVETDAGRANVWRAGKSGSATAVSLMAVSAAGRKLRPVGFASGSDSKAGWPLVVLALRGLGSAALDLAGRLRPDLAWEYSLRTALDGAPAGDGPSLPKSSWPVTKLAAQSAAATSRFFRGRKVRRVRRDEPVIGPPYDNAAGCVRALCFAFGSHANRVS
jgi:hypothetical protein